MAHRAGRWLHLAVAAVALAADAPARAQQPAEPQQLAPAVDRAVLNGYRRYNSTCNHCHGPDGIGSSFAPSLIDRPLPYERFRQIVEQGSASGTSVMRGFATDPNVAPHVRDIYAYLEARAEGRMGRGRPAPAR
ncbi:MAG TPA: cytochrome c [Geminicoccaceae bacterium]|nr:cytochrome c [Geminicoccaceae bacterium]